MRAAAGGGSIETPSLADLRSGLEAAVKAEDYQTAAQIRDRINELEQADPLVLAERELEQAISEERFEDAAAVRDRLKELRPAPPPLPQPAAAFDSSATTASDLVTDGVRVTCRSFYVPGESVPARGAYFFGYEITITNESDDTVKLMERSWVITNGQGKTQQVRGAGVVGEQPELAPGQSFQYRSACPLPTPQGSMEGHYEFYARDKASGQWRRSFLVKIGQFALRSDL
ncbi:hypothetical protein D9Q98_006556 [Chlorella vulgaris]|uniref:Uncharacterized protein n=1 Tax=Chlorella vulgaris TaxID=3077 RepID=A0A9D4TKH2_CHLVU|nr:hypothetical protein D9Q98_006556 [Chlorella vulgaris]